MIIFKVLGKAKIPDYVQMRDDNFKLLAYFRADRIDKAIQKLGLMHKKEAIEDIIANAPFGKIIKIEL